MKMKKLWIIMLTIFLLVGCKKEPKEQWATQIELNNDFLELTDGQSAELSYTLFPEGSIISAAKWTSSNEAVASVTQNGTVTAIAEGEAVVTVCDASRPEIEAYSMVRVSKKQADHIRLNKTQLTLLYNQEEMLTYTLLPEDAILKEPLWTSADSDIAAVDQNGKVTGI